MASGRHCIQTRLPDRRKRDLSAAKRHGQNGISDVFAAQQCLTSVYILNDLDTSQQYSVDEFGNMLNFWSAVELLRWGFHFVFVDIIGTFDGFLFVGRFFIDKILLISLDLRRLFDVETTTENTWIIDFADDSNFLAERPTREMSAPSAGSIDKFTLTGTARSTILNKMTVVQHM